MPIVAAVDVRVTFALLLQAYALCAALDDRAR
jgi:hypothetical protein